MIITTVIFASCKHEIKNNSALVKVNKVKNDSTELKETFNEEDLPSNEYLNEILEPIRSNFKKINSITKWTTIKTKDIWETTEGGEAKFYYLNGQLEKIISRNYGETFQLLTEYYLLNGQLSFVFEKLHKYNRPIYHDSTAMKEMNDTEIFDIEKSDIIEDRSYFDKGKLLHQISSGDCGAPFSNDYLLKEEMRIIGDFNKLIKANSKK